jgi:multidrug resistance efflux pump
MERLNDRRSMLCARDGVIAELEGETGKLQASQEMFAQEHKEFARREEGLARAFHNLHALQKAYANMQEYESALTTAAAAVHRRLQAMARQQEGLTCIKAFY